jgi:hypothetical protein
MPEPRDIQEYEVEFGLDGKCHIRGSEFVEGLLPLAGPENELEMGMEADPVPPPNLTRDCEIPRPPPPNEKICPNEKGLCPLSTRLVLAPERAEARGSVQGDS